MATNLSEQISALATAVGTECKAIRTLIGALDGLTTSTKASVVAAVNELKNNNTSLSNALNTLTTRVGTAESGISTNTGEIATLKSGLSTLSGTVGGMQGDIADLEAAVAAATEISDATTDTDTTWSSTKIHNELMALEQTIKNDILGGAGAAYDTLKELADLIVTNAGAIEALKALAAGHVKYDAAQSLTDAQKTQARTNIAAASQSDHTALANRVTTAEAGINTNAGAINTLSANVGATNTDFVAIFEAALED